jgi:hypothetical protein
LAEPRVAGLRGRYERLRDAGPARQLIERIPMRLRFAIAEGIDTWFADPLNPPGAGDHVEATPPPEPSLEMSLLHRSVWRLDNSKAQRLLDYRPKLSFDEGMRRTIAWLDFAGYDVTPPERLR